MIFYIQEDIVGINSQSIIDAVRELGYQVKEFSKQDTLWKYDSLFEDRDASIPEFVYGSVNEVTFWESDLNNKLMLGSPLKYHHVYKEFGNNTYQKMVKFTPWNCLFESLEPEYSEMDSYGCENYLDDRANYKFLGFVRPDSHLKPFHGQPIPRKDSWKWYKEMTINYNLTDELCVISQYKPIKVEIRTLVIKGEIAQSTIYNGVVNKKVIPKILDRCQSILNLSKYFPYPAFIADFAINDNNAPQILELNSVHCAGLYGMDPKEFVKNIASVYGE